VSLRVLVVGDVMLDVVVKPDTAIAPTSDTPSRVRLHRGGSAANMAEALARAGHHVTYVGASGTDLAAQLFEETLHRAGVETALERLDSSSGVVVALVDREGERAMMTDRGANSSLGWIMSCASSIGPTTTSTCRATPCSTPRPPTSVEKRSSEHANSVLVRPSTSVPWRP